MFGSSSTSIQNLWTLNSTATVDYTISSPIPNYVWNFNSNLKYLIASTTMTNLTSFSYTTDRYDSPNSAVFLNVGSLSLPSAVYFLGGTVTITSWVYPTSTSNTWRRLFDCAGPDGQEDFIISLQQDSTSQCYPYLTSYASGDYTFIQPEIGRGAYLPQNTWSHIAGVFSSRIYHQQMVIFISMRFQLHPDESVFPHLNIAHNVS